MDHTINVLANLIQYQGIRNLEDERWSKDNEANIFPYDKKNIEMVNKYINENKIVFNNTNETDMLVKSIIDQILLGYNDIDCCSDEGWDISTLDNASHIIKSNKSLKDKYLNHRKDFYPIFCDNDLNKEIMEAYIDSIDNDYLGLLIE